MISYIIMHLNRPFLLETNVKLIRKYAPKDTQIIIVDDGSEKFVVEYIKKHIDIDGIYVSKKNINGKLHGSCSNAILGALKLCNGEYVIFSEDDFYPTSSPITVNAKGTAAEGDLMPRIYYSQEADNQYFIDSIDILKNNPHIHNIQLARDIDYNPALFFGEYVTKKGGGWRYLSHAKSPKYYYCNWPYMMRKEEFEKLNLQKNLSITGVENGLNSSTRKKWGKGDWAVCPVRPHYIHVARGFSNKYKVGGTRRTRSDDMQNILLGSSKNLDSKDFNIVLSGLYVSGKFVVDFDMLIEKGLNEAFMSGADKLKQLTG